MAAREASIRLTLKPGAFQSGMRALESEVRSSSRRMGAALGTSMNAGLTSAKTAIRDIGSGLKNGLKTAATLGGALSLGLIVRDSLKLNFQFRNMAFNINKVKGNAVQWQQIQQFVTRTAEDTGASVEDLATAFDDVFKATGDLNLSMDALKVIGNLATASGEDVGHLAQAAQLAGRKFQVTGPEMAEALTRFIEKTGVGGKSLDQLTSRFALVAGEAAAAGTKGAQGISELLGIMLLLDSTIGEKADPGLKSIFQYIKDGTAQMKRLKKEARDVKFVEGEGFTSKMKKILASKKGRVVAEQIFTADARTVYDELSRPFDQAYKAAVDSGMGHAAAVQEGMRAFDANLANASASTMKYQDVLDDAKDRMAVDPTVQLRRAIDRVKIAFSQPQMIDAMERIADRLPAMADGLASVVDYISEKPLQAALMALSARILLAAGASAGASVIKTAAGAAGASLAATQAATAATAVTGAAAAGGGATALGVSGAAAAGGMTAGGAALAATGVAAAGAAGYFGTSWLLDALGIDMQQMGADWAGGNVESNPNRGLGRGLAVSNERTAQAADKMAQAMERAAKATEIASRGTPGAPAATPPRGRMPAPKPVPGALEWDM